MEELHPPIDRLSVATSSAIRIAERTGPDYHLAPGRTAECLAAYRRFLSRPGSRLLLTRSDCPACPGCAYDDVAEVRDALEAVMLALPARPRAELRRLLGPLDAAFLRRTLPNPDPRPDRWDGRQGMREPWWYRRAYDDD
ncbi:MULTISPECIES: hypothetical protein [Streptomyces]|uniref:Uncharacterized protein n=1 Tax=Streptomyces solicathayae TaxID=3081768 RepID=A0ABZ0LZT8_9ACTN|nr:hypothetical protein [Streptomyces sp. HUAS YS2]WOX24957.1 hypothetical protein R2D22_27665 [Streptomyces sp. HUAS YS2]